MGYARKRGSFEERKAQAIAEGRTKVRRKTRREIENEAILSLMGLAAPLSLQNIGMVPYTNIRSQLPMEILKGGDKE